jgi:ABC-type nitrate/sulfonate/bicarbonate transport system permease component
LRILKKYFKLEALSIVALFALWEVASRIGIAPAYLFPPFSETLKSLVGLATTGQLGLHYSITLMRVLMGLGMGSSIGILLGLAIAYSELAYRALYPIVTLLYAVPAVAWIPLFIIWIGLNEALPIAVVFMCSFVPMVYTTLTGIRSLSPSIVRVAQTLGARGPAALFYILLPQALPSILAGLKVEAGMAWRTCFVVEMVAASSGLGLLAMTAQSTLRVDVILAIVLILALSNYAFQVMIERAEVRLLRKWGYVR